MTNIPVSERKNFVGASESAALFGLSPYTTLFELWHQKVGNIPSPVLSSARATDFVLLPPFSTSRPSK